MRFVNKGNQNHVSAASATQIAKLVTGQYTIRHRGDLRYNNDVTQSRADVSPDIKTCSQSQVRSLTKIVKEAMAQEKDMSPADSMTFPPFTETPFPIPPKTTDEDASTTPSLPPAMDSVRSYSTDEVVRMMKKMPLFMTDLEESQDGEDPEDNIQLEALRALQHEGTRAEIALGFKERGNEMVSEKRWKDAKEFYTKGIRALKTPLKPPGSQTTTTNSDETETSKEKQIEEACYVNRALCNLELQNYRSTLLDTSHTLHLSPSSTKALYRSALALLHLSRPTPALDACTRGLALTNPSPTSTSTSKRLSTEYTAFLALRTRILTLKTALEKKAAADLAAADRRNKEQTTLNAALLARGIKIRMTKEGKGVDTEDAIIKLAPDPLSPTSELYFPVLVLYPVHGRSDFVKAVAETERWGDVLGMVMEGGLPWEGGEEYVGGGGGVECFMETVEGGMIKVGHKVRLLDCLQGGKVEVLDGIVRVYVVPKGKVLGWIGEMKAWKGSTGM
ncbi:MAG: hypothetical protein Q9219_002376 [cf. Caloplaca sp. 3 TL-2023]